MIFFLLGLMGISFFCNFC